MVLLKRNLVQQVYLQRLKPELNGWTKVRESILFIWIIGRLLIPWNMQSLLRNWCLPAFTLLGLSGLLRFCREGK